MTFSKSILMQKGRFAIEGFFFKSFFKLKYLYDLELTVISDMIFR